MPAHRQTAAKVRIKDAAGHPVADREVKVRLINHGFLFGAAMFHALIAENGDPNDEMTKKAKDSLDKALALFNFATLPFYWGRFEPERGKPDTARTVKAAKYLNEKGLKVKGHPLCWHTVCAPWLMDMTDGEIFDAQLKRINRDVTEFAGLIDMWDVINEVVIMPIFDKYDNGVTRICKMKGRIPLVREVFAQARRANPNACLLINDFDMSESYDILIEGILEAGIKIDAIGLQSHMHQGAWSFDKTAEILERFSRFGLPLHFTEINLVSGELMPKHIVDLNDYKVDSWPSTPDGEERQAAEAVRLYRQLFEHPSVEAITYWDFTDGGWLGSPCGFLAEDGRVKPIYNAVYDLIHKEWTTDITLKTDADGYIAFTGYKGGYEAAFDGGTMRFAV